MMATFRDQCFRTAMGYVVMNQNESLVSSMLSSKIFEGNAV